MPDRKATEAGRASAGIRIFLLGLVHHKCPKGYDL